MNYTHIVTDVVTPFLFNSLIEKDAVTVREILINHGFDILTSSRTENNSVVLVNGLVGNAAQFIINDFSEKGIYSKVSTNAEALDVLNAVEKIEYFNLNNDLSTIWEHFNLNNDLSTIWESK